MGYLTKAITESIQSSSCTSAGLSIAPIPSSVLSRLSANSITMTWSSHPAILTAAPIPPSFTRSTSRSTAASFTTTFANDLTPTTAMVFPTTGLGLPGSPNGAGRTGSFDWHQQGVLLVFFTIGSLLCSLFLSS